MHLLAHIPFARARTSPQTPQKEDSLNPRTKDNMPTNYSTGYWDPVGEYEFHDTIFTLTVYLPPRPPPKYLPAFLTREPLDTKPFHVIRSNPVTPDYTHFERRHLADMPTKTVKIKAHRFPVGLRCQHLAGVGQRVCRAGCYVLEKGGKEVRRFRCARGEGCEGHVYCGHVKGVGGVKCFGKKGARMACIEGLP
ncbi:hypothetical protein P171DRAFT_491662 [Karstenula rhodostoma CBS 690.94]|uniref:Uncharacterized protein n=1 Tax=Karstenula rhodostoma CBS 690.94 TaxID=1392251 RepID=A0A9P4U4C6_9PLEO|nr:hypothetical protein P171DRAFT_491662 [Karstenula rhodostoma CBS 690.94]